MKPTAVRYRLRAIATPASALAIVLSTLTPPALAQQDNQRAATLEEVIVTAQKREESLQDVPIAVSAMDSEAIENFNISDAKDLGLVSPSLSTPSFPTSSNNLAFFIRGVGNADSNILTRDNSVGLYIDGVYMGRTTGLLADLVDLDRIEILRGPQGTLYGRNTTAGAVNFVSAKPTGEFSLKEEVSLGNYDYWRSRTILNLPEVNGFKTKLAVVASDRDGWVENSGPNEMPGVDYEDYYQSSQMGARLQIAWDVSDQLTVDYAYDYTDMETTPPYYQYGADVIPGTNLAKSYSKRLEQTKSPITGDDFAFPQTLSDTIAEGHSLTITYDINDQLTFKSITGNRYFNSDQDANFGQVFLDFSTPTFFALDYTTHVLVENDQFTQEFQLLGTTDQLHYVVGLFYLDEDGEYTENQTQTLDPLGAPFFIDQGIFKVDSEVESVAVYGQATWSATSQLDLTLGLRYTEDKRSAERVILSDAYTIPAIPYPNPFNTGKNSDDLENLDYSLTLDYAWTDNISTYAKFATGFRSGGASPRGTDFSVSFGEETLETWELGLKSQLLDNRARLNMAVFRSNYDDVIIDFTDAGNPGKVTGLNAGEAQIDGFEFELLVMPIANLQLGVNYTYLNAEITKVKTPPPGLSLTPGNNFEFQWAPENAYSISADYYFDPLSVGDLSVHLDYAWQGEQFASANTDAGKVITDDFGQANARISLDRIPLCNDSLKVALWVKNLTDSEEMNYNLVGLGYAYQEPRRYGVDVSYTF